MNTRLRSLTAFTLVVLYGLVGLTGISLHYLAEELSLASLSGQTASSGGYFHSHQPDSHLHFHHHHHHDHDDETAEPSESYSASEESQTAAGLKGIDQFHFPHACPLLTLISQIKLGQGGWVALCVDLGASHTSTCDANRSHDFGLTSPFYARGPPETSILV